MKGALTTCFKYCRKAGAVAWQKLNRLTLLSSIAILSVPAFQAHAEDLFSGGKATISDTFGSGSTVVWILYIIEILAAVFTYVKTKTWPCSGALLR